MAKTSHFWSFFLFVDTSMILVWAVPSVFWNTAKGIRGIFIFQLSLYFQISQFYFQVGQIVPLSRTITPTTNVVRVSIVITMKSMVLIEINKKFHLGADILLLSSATYWKETLNDITGYSVKPRIPFYSNCRRYKLSFICVW